MRQCYLNSPIAHYYLQQFSIQFSDLTFIFKETCDFLTFLFYYKPLLTFLQVQIVCMTIFMT